MSLYISAVAIRTEIIGEVAKRKRARDSVECWLYCVVRAAHYIVDVYKDGLVSHRIKALFDIRVHKPSKAMTSLYILHSAFVGIHTEYSTVQ